MISLRTPIVSKYNYYASVQNKHGQTFSGADISDLLSKGDKALNENRLEEALQAYTEANQKNPQEIIVYKKLGRTYHNLKDLNNAEANYQTYLSSETNDDEGWIELGEVQRQKGSYQNAVSSFEKALSINPKNDLANRSLLETKNNIKGIYYPEQARKEREEQASRNLQAALNMTTAFLGESYMKDLADVQFLFGQTAQMNGTSNIAQYENGKKTITVSNEYKYAAPQVIASYLVHESTHAHDKDGYTSVYEEQDAYDVQTRFWLKHSQGVQDPEMDYAADLYQKSPDTLRNRVEEIYKLRDPDIEMTSPNHPPDKKSHFWNRKSSAAASQGIKEYSVIA